MTNFHVLQEWEGRVVQIEEEEFVARLVDLTEGLSHESQEAIIPLTEVSERDAARMIVGSIFQWVIGYERSPGGCRRRASRITFRDMPKMIESDFLRGEAWAHRIMRAFSQ